MNKSTNKINEFNNFSMNQILKFLAIIAMSDGTIKNKNEIRLETHNTSLSLHTLLGSFSEKLINKTPTSYLNKRGFLRTNLCSVDLVKGLLKLSPTYKTTPVNEVKEEYLSKPQPTLKFILNESKKIQMLAFRMWFDFEGCVIPRFRLAEKKDKGYFYFDLAFQSQLFLSETNPTLVQDLIDLSKNIGFNATIKNKKGYWSGIDGISVTRKNNVIEFCKQGPLTDVLVSKKSSRFAGCTKRSLCLATLEIFNWPKIHWSFKTFDEAIELKKELDLKLNEIIYKYNET
jgi:hypothetical protein